jgi:hypothetical protein
VKGTRLWQAPGSPIIQGRSHTARPFWETWLWSVLGAAAIVLVAGVIAQVLHGATLLSTAVSAVATEFMIPGLPGCVAGAALGVLLARGMGWRRSWVAGAATGALLAGLTIVFL